MRFRPFILGSFLVAGCVHYQPQPVSPEQTAALLESRRLDDPGLRPFLEQNLGYKLQNWPLDGWDLNSLTLAAFYFHPSLDVARAQWLVAAAEVKTAGARPNPSVTLNPGYDSQIPGNYSPWLVPVTFDLPIETAGKRGKRIAEAEKVSETARWNFISAAWQIRRDVRSSLLDLKISGQKADLLEQQFSAQKQIVALLQQRFAAGEISRPELATAQIALNKTQLNLSDAESAIAAAHAHLAEALGLSEAALNGENFKFVFSKPGLAELTAPEARAVALRSRADILAALADYAAAEDDLRLQIARQYPDLHLGPGYAWNYGNAGDNQWSLGVTLELPILDQNQGPIAEATARRKLAAAKFIELQSQVIAGIDRAIAGLRAAREQLKNGNELITVERWQEKSMQAQLAAGAAEQLDVLNARLETGSALLTQLDNEAKLQSAIGELEDALQRPTDSLAVAIVNMAAEDPAGKEAHP
jgi:outer membrane protein, heavy metal efflux system